MFDVVSSGLEEPGLVAAALRNLDLVTGCGVALALRWSKLSLLWTPGMVRHVVGSAFGGIHWMFAGDVLGGGGMGL